MKTASAIECYEKYFNLHNCLITVLLTDGSLYTGWFVGIVRDETAEIIAWRFLERSSSPLSEIDPFLNESGELIYHCNIVDIYFEEDGQTMRFRPALP
jgi:hypothetical protein